MTKKWQEIKDRIKNPPADRLAKVEYQSHFLNMIGTTAVCIILLFKGFWYIIFALIFSLGVSYSQGMTAYKKYQMIATMKGETPIEKEISPSRKKDRIIKETIGNKALWISAVFAGLIPALIIPSINKIIYSLSYAFLAIAIFTVIYYFPIYWIANYIYRRKE